MVIAADLLGAARTAAKHVADAERDLDVAKADYHHAIRQLHVAGGSLREIAEELGISYQRVHQIVEGQGGVPWRRRSRVPDGLECAFCDSEKDDVRQLIAGPGLAICDRCTHLAQRAIQTRAAASDTRTTLAPVRRTKRLACSFCGKRPGDRGAKRKVAWLAVRAGIDVQICDECVTLCRSIIAEHAGDAK